MSAIVGRLLGRTVGWRTALGPVLGVVALAALTGQTWSTDRQNSHLRAAEQEAATVQATLQDAVIGFSRSQAAILQAMLWLSIVPDPALQADAKKRAEASLDALDFDHTQGVSEALRKLTHDYVGSAKQVVDFLDDPSIAGAMIVDTEAKAKDAQAQFNAAEATARLRVEAASKAMAKGSARALQQHFIAALASASLVLVLGLFAARSISRPARRITAALDRLSRGEKIGALPPCGISELDAISAATAEFAESLSQAANLEREQAAAAQRNAEEQTRVREEATEKASHEAAQLVVNSIGIALEHLSRGDLTVRVEQALPPAYAKLADDLNMAIGKLEQVMTSVVANTSAIGASTGELAQAADNLSRRTEQQAASLEETAASLDQLTSTVRSTATGAREAHDAVGRAKEGATASSVVMHDAASAMQQIDNSSRQIGQIVGVIDEIAFQTNLLALNAGVEAARAGDSGRGFAVVASEVRALAQRSAEAAKEIKGLISQSNGHVQSGVKLVGDTGAAMERIVSQVVAIEKIVSGIADSARDQATRLHEVNQAMVQMDQVTQQNAAMVEQSTAAVRSIAGDARELTQLTDTFVVQGKPVARNATIKPQLPAPTHATRPLKVVAGTASRQSAQAAEWEEF